MKNLKTYFPPIFLMFLIFTESSIPMDGGPNNIAFLTSLNPTLQNLLHIPLYGVLAFLWSRVFLKNGFSYKKIVLLALFITISYGCLDELHQTFVPGRYGSLVDICLDSLGAFFGIFVFNLSRKPPVQISNT
jgi:VanZ family protein